jgi:serine protease 56
VCCPDEVIDSANPEFGGRLPATGEEIPVWGVSDLDGNVLDQAEEAEADAIIARPEERGCGLATKQFPKITGGRPADPGEWPWMVALLSRQPRTSAYCGGVLVTDRHVLTAAHCTMNHKVNDLYVRLGEYDFTRYNETRSRDFRVVEIRQHVDFDATT